MTSEVLALSEKNPIRQTTLRVEAELLRKARFYLDEDGKSVQEFLAEQLAAYVRKREKKGDLPRSADCA